jgi:hypothetical protein
MTKTIRLNAKNSKLIGDRVFITELKAQKISQNLQTFLNRGSKITHPVLGTLIEYNGPFTRVKN